MNKASCGPAVHRPSRGALLLLSPPPSPSPLPTPSPLNLTAPLNERYYSQTWLTTSAVQLRLEKSQLRLHATTNLHPRWRCHLGKYRLDNISTSTNPTPQASDADTAKQATQIPQNKRLRLHKEANPTPRASDSDNTKQVTPTLHGSKSNSAWKWLLLRKERLDSARKRFRLRKHTTHSTHYHGINPTTPRRLGSALPSPRPIRLT